MIKYIISVFVVFVLFAVISCSNMQTHKPQSLPEDDEFLIIIIDPNLFKSDPNVFIPPEWWPRKWPPYDYDNQWPDWGGKKKLWET